MTGQENPDCFDTAASPGLSGTYLKVFVAEDNPADLFWLEMVFKNTGLDYTLAVARDGEAARNYLLSHPGSESYSPDLILLDMNMPRLTALDILRQLPGSERLPLCILTGGATQQQFKESSGQSIQHYILKPLTQAKLIDCLQCFEPLLPFADKLRRRFTAGYPGRSSGDESRSTQPPESSL